MGDEKTAEQLIQEAELRQAIAEAERAEAQARKARYEARASAGEGRTTADQSSGYPATLAAFQAMVQKAGDVATAVEGQCAPGGGARILIVDSLDFCGPDVQAIQVSAQLDFWLAELEARTAALDRTLQQLAERAKLDKTAVLAAAGGVAAAVGAAAEVAGLAADVVGYFRAGYDIKGQTISLPNAALQALVAGRLDRQKCSVFLPAFHRLESPGDIPVVAKLNECIRRKDRLKQQVAALRSLSAGQKGQEAGTMDGARGLAAEIEAACKNAGAAHRPVRRAQRSPHLPAPGAAATLPWPRRPCGTTWTKCRSPICCTWAWPPAAETWSWAAVCSAPARRATWADA